MLNITVCINHQKGDLSGRSASVSQGLVSASSVASS
jgi:hypothetical protein